MIRLLFGANELLAEEYEVEGVEPSVAVEVARNRLQLFYLAAVQLCGALALVRINN